MPEHMITAVFKSKKSASKSTSLSFVRSQDGNDRPRTSTPGYSLSIMKAFLTCKEVTPMTVFLNTISNYVIPVIDTCDYPVNKSLIDIKRLKNAIKKCEITSHDGNINNDNNDGAYRRYYNHRDSGTKKRG